MCYGPLNHTMREVAMDNFENGKANTIHVPVCGECYQTLATNAGIDRLTQAVNG